MEVKLSFIIVAYGNSNTLRTCLSSLLDQTETSREIIVCDNSPEEAAARANEFLCSSLDDSIAHIWTADRTAISMPHIRHKQCLYTAIEIGVKSAHGDWINFMGQDGYHAPVFAERMLLLAEVQPELEFIHCDTVLGGPHHGYFTLGTRPANCAIDLQSFIMRRQWFQGFPDKHVNYEIADGFFVESLVARGIKTGHLAQVLTVKN